MTVAPTPEHLSFTDADARLDGALSDSFLGSYRSVLLFDGDLCVEGDFLTAMLMAMGTHKADVIAVAGDLTVAGPIALYEGRPGLYVGGFTRGETLEGGDCEIHINDGEFTYLVLGYYNDGVLYAGEVKVPWVINDNHDLEIEAPEAMFVDNYGADDEAHYDRSNIGKAFVKKVVDPEYDSIKIGKFLKRLRAGKRVLRKGSRTVVEAAIDEVASAVEARAEELDLTGHKLKQFPAQILAMPWLKRLTLDNNEIEQLPDEIGDLSSLEYLSVRSCGLGALPESIGRLTKLQILRVADNGRRTYDDASENWTYQPICLPEALGDLSRLEELDVSQLSMQPDSDSELLPELTTFALPDSIGRLTSLRRLVADCTNLTFPTSAYGLASLREISMSGSTWLYLKRLPDWVTSLPNLTKLDLSDNFFTELPASMGSLTSLEELNLSGSLGLLTSPLPDLSSLTRLRVLRLSGNTSHTSVPVPSHDLLRQLFTMTLPALEVLDIDRWGASDKGPRTELTAEIIAGIGSFQALRRVDLCFNGLTDLPEDFLSLPALEWVDLHYNALRQAVRQRVAATYPNAQIDFRNQKTAEDDAERTALRAASAKISTANQLRDAGRVAEALTEYDRAIAEFTDGTAVSAYGLLYARYGKLWLHNHAVSAADTAADARPEHLRGGAAEAKECLRLVPPVWNIFHFTDEGQFQREVVRQAANFLAWYTLTGELAAAGAIEESEATPQRALELIEMGVDCADGSQHLYLHDTHARVLLALGREPDAWRVVHRSPRTGPGLRRDRRPQGGRPLPGVAAMISLS